MSEPKGYYRIEPLRANPFTTASLAEIVEQLLQCEYRCEAGSLRMNLAFIELRRRAEAEARRAGIDAAIGRGLDIDEAGLCQCDTCRAIRRKERDHAES